MITIERLEQMKANAYGSPWPRVMADELLELIEAYERLQTLDPLHPTQGDPKGENRT